MWFLLILLYGPVHVTPQSRCSRCSLAAGSRPPPSADNDNMIRLFKERGAFCRHSHIHSTDVECLSSTPHLCSRWCTRCRLADIFITVRCSFALRPESSSLKHLRSCFWSFDSVFFLCWSRGWWVPRWWSILSDSGRCLWSVTLTLWTNSTQNFHFFPRNCNSGLKLWYSLQCFSPAIASVILCAKSPECIIDPSWPGSLNCFCQWSQINY